MKICKRCGMPIDTYHKTNGIRSGSYFAIDYIKNGGEPIKHIDGELCIDCADLFVDIVRAFIIQEIPENI